MVNLNKDKNQLLVYLLKLMKRI